MKKLITFNGEQKTKDFYLNRLKLHAAADELIQGTGWGDGKGCAVGCTLENYSHAAYETELGIPRILARLEDRIFEGMSNENAQLFPIQFLEAVPVGVDLKDVFKKFFIWMLTDAEYGVIRFAKTDKSRSAIQGVSDLLEKSLLEEVTSEQFLEVRKIAADAYDAAADAYDADAYDAAAYAAYDAAADAAYAAADAAAADAAYAADAYAYAAAYATYAAAYAAAADADARKSHYFIMGQKLIQIISETK